MVKDLIITTKQNIKKYNLKTLKDVYNNKYPVVEFSNKMKKFDKKIKDFLKMKMYHHKSVKSKANQGKKIINKLFHSIRKNPYKYLNVNKYKKKANIERSTCDFIAGMTDRYAINLYNKIK